jgi:1-deoxy-D-xylulose-5-phosphate synthase
LGAVEIAIALHYVYDTPYDKLVWDVGHQAYPHKILTGRKEALHTIRQCGGLSPFLKREESEYDAFGVGHSSTSVSAALGMAIASQLKNEDRKAVAIIGDGAMTAGMVFEALNHAGALKTDMLIVLNDNDMSISGNVGALNNYFARVWSGKTYQSIKNGGKRVLQKMPNGWGEFMRRTEEHLKGMVAPGTFFEELGINYIGPIDGHDLKQLISILHNMQALKGPQLLHIVTKKGKGYAPAEADPIAYHAVKPHFYHPLEKKIAKPSLPTYSNIFGKWLTEMAHQDDKIIGITPAMAEGSDLLQFKTHFPDRYFDVGIAEQHALTLAAGMASMGLKPVVAIYSSFLQRAYDQLIHDIATQNLPVLLTIDRAGVVGGDGVTHQGAFDISYLRCIPNMTIMTPSDENELKNSLYTGYQLNSPVAVRYPRGAVTGKGVEAQMQAFPVGKARVLRQGKRLALLAFGPLLHQIAELADTLDATLVDMRFVKPLDEALLFEENALMGGAGSAVNEFVMQHQLPVKILNQGFPDAYIEHGEPDKIMANLGLDKIGLAQTIQEFYAS